MDSTAQPAGPAYEVLLLLVACAQWVYNPLPLPCFPNHLFSGVGKVMKFGNQLEPVEVAPHRKTGAALVDHQEAPEHTAEIPSSFGGHPESLPVQDSDIRVDQARAFSLGHITQTQIQLRFVY